MRKNLPANPHKLKSHSLALIGAMEWLLLDVRHEGARGRCTFPSASETKNLHQCGGVSHWQILHQAGAVMLCSDSQFIAILK